MVRLNGATYGVCGAHGARWLVLPSADVLGEGRREDGREGERLAGGQNKEEAIRVRTTGEDLRLRAFLVWVDVSILERRGWQQFSVSSQRDCERRVN